jgi:molybdate transport system permease protein
MTAGLSPLWISLATSFTATALAFVLGIAAAAAMARYRGGARGFLDGVLTLPLVLPPTVAGFFLLLLFGRRSAIGHLLEQAGLPVAFSWPGTVVAATVVAFPLMYRATLGAFEQVHPNYLGAARTLGAGEWRTLRRVILPLARPGVIAGTVLAFARALGEFGATLMLAGNIPGKTQTMPVAIFFAAEGGDMQRALHWVAATVVMSLASIAALNSWAPRAGVARRHRGPPVEGGASQPPVAAGGTVAPFRTGQRGAGLAVDLCKRYPGFELSAAFLARGGRLGLLGASGSGKSLTLRCIAGLERPDRGRVTLGERVLLDTGEGIDRAPAERRIGIVFQDYALFPHLTVRENIGFGLYRRTAEEQMKRVAEWSRMMQVNELLDSYPGEISGGQRQRVALARALAMEPEALLLDEPFSALDAHLRRQMEEQLRRTLSAYGGVTILVTHDRDEAYRFCEDLVVLSDGRVAAEGTKSEIFARPRTLAVARLTGCKNFAPLRIAGGGRVEVPDWNCTLTVPGPIPEGTEYVGIRAHDLQITDHPGGNTFPCWLVTAVEAPFETTLYLRLHARPDEGEQAHVEAEVSREAWAELAGRPQPWRVAMPAEKLLLVRR